MPGVADSGAARRDEPLFPKEVLYHHQPVAWVLGSTLEAARLGAARVTARYRPLDSILSIEDALAQASFHSGPLVIERGAAADALARSPHRIEGEIRIGGQEHFYLETQSAIAWLDETGGVALHCSTQHPSETQEIVARVLGVPRHQVTVECLRMGGAFGGKEDAGQSPARPSPRWARGRPGGPCACASPARLDMMLTGKRHPFLARFEAGLRRRRPPASRPRPALLRWRLEPRSLRSRARARHVPLATTRIYIPALEVTGFVCKTHKTSQTAFRGFGGPQGMLVIEEILDRVARTLGLPPERVRERNFYREGDTTHYGQPVQRRRAHRAHLGRVEAVQRFRGAPRRRSTASITRIRTRKRGLAITPVKFGISFTATLFNQAGALVLIYRDGSVQVNHGGTEMGQGLYTKIRQIAAAALWRAARSRAPHAHAHRQGAQHVRHRRVVRHRSEWRGGRWMPATELRATLAPVAAGPAALRCRRRAPSAAGGVFAERDVPTCTSRSPKSCEAAYRQRLPLFAQGYYRTPEIHYDPKTRRGRPFYYFAYGAAVSEVEIDGFTGQLSPAAHRHSGRRRRLRLADDRSRPDRRRLHSGRRLVDARRTGLGCGRPPRHQWRLHLQTSVLVGSAGRFSRGVPERAAEPGVVCGSKAVGEPPLMLAISVREAIRDAIAAYSTGIVELDSPCTPERIFFAVQKARQIAAGPAVIPAGAAHS